MASPFVRRRRLGAVLRALREERGLTADDLCRRIYRSRIKISKLENGHVRPDLAELMNLLDALGVTGSQWSEIIELARQAAERGWWDSYGDAMGPRQRLYADVESGAATIRSYNQIAIPGLLQTTEFTQALIELDEADGGPADYVPERSLAARRQRQSMASRPGGPSYETVLDEFVLRRLAVPAPVMCAQLRHIVAVMTREPRFSVRVLPFDARLPGGRLPPSPFNIYTFPDPDDPDMAIAETTNADVVHTAHEEVAHFVRLYDRLRQASLSPVASMSRLEDIAEQIAKEAGSPT